MLDKLPKGWVRTTLEDVCLPVANIQPKDSPETEFIYFDIGGIDKNSNRITETKTLNGRNAPSRARQVVLKGDILFSTVRTYLRKIALVERTYKNPIASTGFTVIRAAEGVSPKFLFYQVLSEEFLQPIHALQSGSSYPAVRNRDVFDQPILLLPSREQERIVAKLDAAWTGLERAEIAICRAQERLKGYRATILQMAVTGELTSRWREAQRNNKKINLETGEALLQRLLTIRRIRWEEAELQRFRAIGKEPEDDKWKSRYSEPMSPKITNLQHQPQEWSWTNLNQLKVYSIYGPRYSRNDYANDGVAVLRTTDIDEGGRVSLEMCPKLPLSDIEYEKYKVDAGDLLITRTGSIGTLAIFNDTVKAIPGAYLLHYRLSDPAVVGFVYIYFKSPNGQKQLWEKSAGSGRQNLSAPKLESIVIPFPPLAEQIEIVREVEQRLSVADRLSTSLEQQLNQAHATRQSLLSEAFSGRLVPQNPDDESASLLLDRIRIEKNQIKAERKLTHRKIKLIQKKIGDSMQKQPPSPDTLSIAWERIGKKTDARRLFDEAGFDPDHVVEFYETLRAIPEVRSAFQDAAQKIQQLPTPTKPSKETHFKPKGRFRLVELWLADFKNLKDYTVRFDPAHGLNVILGWNGTGKSNLFEALVIIFRDLYEWWEKNRWPDKPMNGYRVRYEIDEHTMEVTWRPGQMKRPELRKGPIARTAKKKVKLKSIKRDQLPLPRSVFGYYSGPTNRLAEHFISMKQAHYNRLLKAKTDDEGTMAELLEQRRFFCAETHHAKYVLLAFSYKEDTKISKFLSERLRIVGFESALFVIRKPRWAKSRSKAKDFWGAKGIVRGVMERLHRYAIAPMVLEQTVSYGYRSTTEDHYYFFLPDLDSLHSFAAEYQDARTFFLALESTDFSELIHDVMIQVRIKASNTDQVPITFHQLSEGEQQLLMVLGLMRFTKSHQSLVLLDEPDTHLNPHWSVEYLKDLTSVMSDNALESPEQQSSQILMATHDPLVIASLVKEQIHLLKRDTETDACKWEPASVNPRGLGFTGILTSEMFGFRSDLDPETLADLDNRVRLIAKEDSLSSQEKEELEKIDKRLADTGFSKAFSDPYFAAFVRAWGRKHSELMAGEQFLTSEKRQEIDRIASQVLKEAIEEVEKEVSD